MANPRTCRRSGPHRRLASSLKRLAAWPSEPDWMAADRAPNWAPPDVDPGIAMFVEYLFRDAEGANRSRRRHKVPAALCALVMLGRSRVRLHRDGVAAGCLGFGDLPCH